MLLADWKAAEECTTDVLLLQKTTPGGTRTGNLGYNVAWSDDSQFLLQYSNEFFHMHGSIPLCLCKLLQPSEHCCLTELNHSLNIVADL